MKRLAIAGVLALGLVACSQQRASAWCKFNFSAGFNISYESSGFCFSSCFSGYSNPCPYGGCGFSGYGGYPAGGGYDALAADSAYAPAAAAVTAPASNFTAPRPTPSAAPSPSASSYMGTQPVSYSYYGQGGYGGYTPGYYQAPSYWYDR
jgi:hypothetical protein